MTRNFFLAAALSLAIALGGLVWLDGGRAQASSYQGTAITASAVTDQDACSTIGSYNYSGYYPNDVVYASAVNGLTMPFGYPFYGYMGYWPGWTNPVTTTAMTVPSVYIPNVYQPNTAPPIVNYACNAFSNCVPDFNSSICPGNPASITLNSSLTSATCGSATNVDAKVVGPTGMIVADGTPVLVTATLGMVPDSTSTTDGVASFSLVFTPKTQGTATLTVTSGQAKTEAKITVTC